MGRKFVVQGKAGRKIKYLYRAYDAVEGARNRLDEVRATGPQLLALVDVLDRLDDALSAMSDWFLADE